MNREDLFQQFETCLVTFKVKNYQFIQGVVFIRLLPYNAFLCHNPTEIKYLIRLQLNFSLLCDNRFKTHILRHSQYTLYL